MAYLRKTLAVLTLLQLSRAEISDKQPESWYLANVISDGFEPKPISEIFTTEPPFSSTNPIIDAPKSNALPDEILLLSTVVPPTSKLTRTASASEEFTKVSMPPFTESTLLSPTVQQQSVSQTSPALQPQSQAQSQPQQQLQTQRQLLLPQEIQPQIESLQHQQFQLQEEPLPQQQLQPQTQQLPQLQPIKVEVQSKPQQTTQLEPIPIELQTTQSQSRQPETPSQQIRFGLVPQQALSQLALLPQPQQLPQAIPSQPNLTETSITSPKSDYFLIYQAPQYIQGYRQQVQKPSVSAPPVPQTLITRRVVSSTSPHPIPVIASQQIRLVPPVPIIQSLPITRFSTVPNWITRSGRTNVNCEDKSIQPSITTPIPQALPVEPLSSAVFPIKIRVVAPTGSITNVRINPTSTTKRPSTTRTRRTSRPKKNSYDVCIDACKGRRDPICGAPLSANPVDPNTLKGFPSICHMACHNSFRKERYEKLIDGRCGRLRTRIRTVDSNSKLKRDELNKAQYFVDNTGPNTVVEFSGPLNLAK